MVWMNERRAVKTDIILNKARESCQSDINTDNIDSSNDYKLVHCIGTTVAEGSTCDEKFGLVIDRCIKIERKVEVFQWVERSGRDDDDQRRIDKEWSTDKISQPDSVHDGMNPKVWPVESEDILNDRVSLGNFTLSDGLIAKLAESAGQQLDMAQYSETVIGASSQHLETQGYQPFSAIGGYFYTRMASDTAGSQVGNRQDIVGDVRVSWRIVNTGPATIVAQQIPGLKGPTFRQWNPCKIEDENNDPDISVACPTACCCCFLVEKLFKEGFKEVIEWIIPETKSSK